MIHSGSFIKTYLLLIFISICTVSCIINSNPQFYTPSKDYHIVRPGETLESIGNIYAISKDNLILFNNLKSNRIFPGQKLYLEPQLRLKREYVTVRSIPSRGYHIVKSKETITRIAKMYDISLIEIMNMNKFKTFDLKTGQKIKLNVDSITPESDKPALSETTVIPETEKEKEKLVEEQVLKKLVKPKKSDLTLPLKGIITSEFGMRDGKPHKGIDVAAEIGVPVLAAMNGKVVYVGTQRGYGNVIILEHQNYIMTVYAHNETNLVRQDDIVSGGQPIATVGDTGTTSGPHLHFEYRVRGKAVNPRELFPNF